MTGTGVVTGAERRGGPPALGLLAALMIVVWSGACPAEVLNPSFETTYLGTPYPRLLPQCWMHADHPSFNSYCTKLWSTDGGSSAALVSLIGKTFSPGNRETFYQIVDLTGIGSIEFDVSLAVYPAGVFDHFEAAFLVDGVPLWSQTAGGVYRDQQVNVAALRGWHRIEMRSLALDAGAFSVAYWTQWDNLRLVQGPTTVPAVIDLDPNTLNLGSHGNWVTCFIELPDGYDVGNIDGATVTLNDIPAYMGEQGWATPEVNAENVADFDADGVLERMVRFERAAVQAVVSPPEATVMVKGRLTGGAPFEGKATIRVLDKGAKKT